MMRKHRYIPLGVAILVVVCVISGALWYQAHSNDGKVSTIDTRSQTSGDDAELLKSTSLEDKIGQMIMVSVYNRSDALWLARNYHVGGFLLGGGSASFSARDVTTIRESSNIEPLIAMDEEGGEVTRLGNDVFKQYSAKVMGGLSDKEITKIGYDIGQALAANGVDVDLAPVVDVDSGSKSSISQLGRAFSSDPNVIVQKASAFVSGLQQASVIPVYKHFPGLGRATSDSGGNTDSGAATTPPLESLKSNDLIPYETLLKKPGKYAVMVGNQIVPGLTGGRPASLSPETYKLLRGKYDFQQLVMTDELLQARSISDYNPNAEQAVVMAIAAGADMVILDPGNINEIGQIRKAISTSVNDGQIPISQINQSFLRIMRLKGKL